VCDKKKQKNQKSGEELTKISIMKVELCGEKTRKIKDLYYSKKKI